MWTLRLLTLAALVAPATGCAWLERVKRDGVGSRPTGAVEDVTAAQLVGYLNDRAGRLQSIDYKTTTMVVSGKGLPVPATLDGELASAQPKSFRLTGSGRIASSKVVMGSNDQQFWLYVDAPGGPPNYVFASHADFKSGVAKLPNDIPFEPEWVMQALGMTTYPADGQYAASTDKRDRSYTLGWSAQTPGGLQIRKEVVFDHDGGGARPVVKRHVIRDARTNKEIASADIRTAETVAIGADAKGNPVPVQYPTHVVLQWVEQDFKMDLRLRDAQVNRLTPDDGQRLFARPNIPRTNAIDLAGGPLR